MSKILPPIFVKNVIIEDALTLSPIQLIIALATSVIFSESIPSGILLVIQSLKVASYLRIPPRRSENVSEKLEKLTLPIIIMANPNIMAMTAAMASKNVTSTLSR